MALKWSKGSISLNLSIYNGNRKEDKMECLNCDSRRFDRKTTLFPVELEGKTVEVFSEAFVCSKCGESLMDSTQMNALRKAAADEYRKKHGPLNH